MMTDGILEWGICTASIARCKVLGSCIWLRSVMRLRPSTPVLRAIFTKSYIGICLMPRTPIPTSVPTWPIVKLPRYELIHSQTRILLIGELQAETRHGCRQRIQQVAIGRVQLDRVPHNLDRLLELMPASRVVIHTVDLGQSLGALRAFVAEKGMRHLTQPLQRKEDYRQFYTTAVGPSEHVRSSRWMGAHRRTALRRRSAERN